jgi:uncharacterized protein YndB with AHSA1/START domain
MTTRDIGRIIGAVSREVSEREKDDAPARVMVASRSYDTDVDDLWDALTNPERIPRWFLPVSGEFRLGGRYQIEGNASGEILACAPPERLGLTWEMQGQVSWVTVELSREPEGGTHLTLEHVAHVPDELWDQFGPGAVGVGWDSALFGLEQHFATGETVRPENAMAWLASEEGRSFLRQSSDAWCTASIAAGTDAASARAAAERTRAAYTGEEVGTAEG